MTQRYNKYKDSGIEWIGEIPEHWQTIKGQFIFDVINEKTAKGDEELLSVSEHYGIKKRSESNVNMFMASSYEGYKLCQKGDLVINSLWAWSRGLGFSNYDGIVSTAYSVFRLKIKYEVGYLNYLLRIEKYVNQYLIASKGIWISRLQLSDWAFLRLQIILPPFPEQEAIAQFLDEKCARIDDAIRIKEKQIDLLKEYRQIAIHKAVTKGLNDQVKMKDSGIDWIGEIPEHWLTIPIRRVIKITDGTHDTPLYIDKGENTYPLITSKDFSEGRVCFDECKYISTNDHNSIKKRSEVCNGDILMSMIGGNIGKSVIVDSDFEFSVKNVAIFKTKNDGSQAKYLLYYLDSGLLSNQIQIKSRGGAQGFLSLADIKNLIFFKIPLHEQTQIVAHLESLTTKTDEAIHLKEQQIEQLKQYKNSLINDVVTGKVRVA